MPLGHISHERVPQDDEQEFIVHAVDLTFPSLVDHLSLASNDRSLHIPEWSRVCSIRGLASLSFWSKRCCYGCLKQNKLQRWSHGIGEYQLSIRKPKHFRQAHM